MTLQILGRSSTMESALEAIRNAILNDTFGPGEQLKQSFIAQQLGISQGMVREALNRLIEEGLVMKYPYRGMFVCELTEEDIHEIYQLRYALESLAIELALPHLKDPDAMQVLVNLNAAIAEEHQSADPNLTATADIAFHRYLVQLSGNSRLIKAWEAITAQSKYVLRRLYAIEPKVASADHSDWLAILAEGEIKAIRAFILDRMEHTKAKILDFWANL